MRGRRPDVQRLFGHFGLDPADYVVSFAHPVEGASMPVAVEHAFAQGEAGPATEPDSRDHRDLEPTR